jgi:tetratricopeptide (TPR) repeat protein
MSTRRLNIIEGLLSEARRLGEEGRFEPAFIIASGLLALADVSSTQIPGNKLAREAAHLIKLMSQQVRTTLREAYKAKDLDDVIAAGEAAGDLLLELPDVAAIYARSLHAAGRTEEALALMKRTRARNRDSFIAGRWTARLAAIAGDYSTALETYGEIRLSRDASEPEIESEVDRFFAGVEGRALKQLRRLIVAADYDSALRLARLIRREVGAEERVEKELGRLHSVLRRRLKEIEEAEGEAEESETVLRQIIEIRPADVRMLRKLALQLMQQRRFGEAAETWERISRVEPGDAAASRQRERCLKMAERRAAAWQTEIDAPA